MHHMDALLTLTSTLTSGRSSMTTTLSCLPTVTPSHWGVRLSSHSAGHHPQPQGKSWWAPMGIGQSCGRNISTWFALPTHTVYSNLRSIMNMLLTSLIPVETQVISYDSATWKWLHEHGDLNFGDTHKLLNTTFNHLGGSGGVSTRETGIRKPKGGMVQGMEILT